MAETTTTHHAFGQLTKLPLLLTPDQIKEIAGLGKDALRRMRREGKITLHPVSTRTFHLYHRGQFGIIDPAEEQDWRPPHYNLNSKEVCEELGVTRKTLYNMVDDGLIQKSDLSGSRVFYFRYDEVIRCAERGLNA